MNRSIYALLTAVLLVSTLNIAQAETMEERKQRIMRKYMRERQDVSQSDLGVPEAEVEDARVLESEQFKEPSVEFKRQQGVSAPPPALRPVPLQQDRNWWLETTDTEGDLFSDPFASKSETEEKSKSAWSPWGKREDSSIYGGDDGRQQGWRREDSYPGGQPAYGAQSDSGYGISGSGVTDDGYTSRWSPTSRESDRLPGIYERQQRDARRTDSGWGGSSSGRYGTLPSSGYPNSTIPSSSAAQGWNSQNQTPGYTPYRSPYQSEDQRRRSGDSLQPQQPQYTRPDNFQKWKDSNKAWDPTSDNPYLDELMPNQRR